MHDIFCLFQGHEYLECMVGSPLYFNLLILFKPIATLFTYLSHYPISLAHKS